jgi:ABC-2 type transport system permease protein
VRATWIIFRREVSAYFSSPLAYLIAFAFLLMTGIIFNNDLANSITVKSVNPALIPDFLSLLMVLFAPLFTMRLLSEESREGTLELLLTAPVPDYSIVFGKFLSAWFYYSFLLGLTLLYQIILVNIGFPDFVHTTAAYLGIWLYGGATLAVGLMYSSLTENQIIAAFLSTITLFILWIGDLAGDIVASIDLARVIRNLTLQGHYSTSFAVGIIRLSDTVYYAGMIVIMLFLTIQFVESRRW